MIKDYMFTFSYTDDNGIPRFGNHFEEIEGKVTKEKIRIIERSLPFKHSKLKEVVILNFKKL